MKVLIISSLMLFISSVSFAQKYSKQLLDSFCNETIEYYYKDLLNSSKDLNFLNFNLSSPKILITENTKNLKSNFKDFAVNYVREKLTLDSISLTESKIGFWDVVQVKELIDTINVKILHWTIKVNALRMKNGKPSTISSSMSCDYSDIFGNIPICRFIFNKYTNSWTKYTWYDIANMSETSDDQ